MRTRTMLLRVVLEDDGEDTADEGLIYSSDPNPEPGITGDGLNIHFGGARILSVEEAD